MRAVELLPLLPEVAEARLSVSHLPGRYTGVTQELRKRYTSVTREVLPRLLEAAEARLRALSVSHLPGRYTRVTQAFKRYAT
eukprot:7087838-Pyramimonas_sp.AAC.1